MGRKCLALLTAASSLLGVQACTPPRELIEGEQLLVLEGATLIDGSGRDPVSNAVVVVAEGRVLRLGVVGDFTYPDGTEVVDLRGRWLLPGLIEMHAHLPDSAEARADTLVAYLRYGVTTVVDPGASETGLALKDHDFGRPTPRVFSAGRFINGPGWLSGRSLFATLRSAEEVREEVERSVTGGADFIKIGPHLPPDLVCVAIDEAHRRDTKAVGHLGVTAWGEAVGCGIDMIVHSGLGGPTWELVSEANRERFRDNILTPVAGRPTYDASLFADWRSEVDLSAPAFQGLVAAMREAGVAIDPNLVMIESIVFSDDAAVQERLSPGVPVEFYRKSVSATWDEEDFAEVQATWPTFLDMVRQFHEAGLPLTAGSDLSNQWITAGPAYHRELELLVSAGISPLDVITIATKNPASFLGVDAEIGGVFAGSVADLVILRANPLESISNTQAIEAVYRAGQRVER
jgi:hypothetical protein